MTRPSAPELEALLEQGKQIPAVPAAVRARVLTRARATAALAGSARPPRSRISPAILRPAALVAAMVLGMGIAGAVVLLRDRKPAPAADANASAPVAVRPALSVLAPPTPPAPLPSAPLAPSAPEPHPSAKAASPRESYAAELELLRRAQAAYASGDFSGSLVSLNEHARQFPNGRLAEEREALRVSCLRGLGRSSDARRAVTSFAQRFPHSVLLSRTTAPETPPSN